MDWIFRLDRPAAQDLPVFIEIEDIVVPTHGSQSGPLVPGQDNELVIAGELFRQSVQLRPESIGHLKAIGLMTREIGKRRVPRVLEVLLGGIGTHGFPALTVHVSPEETRGRFVDVVIIVSVHPQRSGLAGAQGRVLRLDAQDAGAATRKRADLTAAPLQLDLRRQLDRNARSLQCDRPFNRLADRVSPTVLGPNQQTNGVCGRTVSTGRRHQTARLGRHDLNARKIRHKLKYSCCEPVDRNWKLAVIFDIGLGAGSPAASRSIPEDDGDFVPRLQWLIENLNVQMLLMWPDVAQNPPLRIEHRPGPAAGDGQIVILGRIGQLGTGPVAHDAERHPHGPTVIDAAGRNLVTKCPRAPATCLDPGIGMYGRAAQGVNFSCGDLIDSHQPTSFLENEYTTRLPGDAFHR